MPVFLDTNILLYAAATDPQSEGKRSVARALLKRDDCVISVQVLQEFYVQATMSSRPTPMPHADAVDLIRVWRRFDIVEQTFALFLTALDIRTRTNFAYWDCAVIAAAKISGSTVLYTEDVQHDREIDGVRIVNPFLV